MVIVSVAGIMVDGVTMKWLGIYWSAGARRRVLALDIGVPLRSYRTSGWVLGFSE